MKKIELTANIAHQSFSVLLGEYKAVIRLDYMPIGRIWNVEIDIDNIEIRGSALTPDIDLFCFINDKYGELNFTGDDATFSNLGIDNKLTWTPQNE